MASQGPQQGPQPPPGMPFNQQQIQQMIMMEAQKRGMTVQQFQDFQRRQIEEAAKQAGMGVQEFVAMKQEEARQAFIQQQQQMQAQAQAQQQAQNQPQGQQQGEQSPTTPQSPQQQGLQQIQITNPPEPKPEALAVAKFLRSQDLKVRTCIHEGQRRDMFKVKRAFRALNSDAYKKARSKNPLLPEVTNDEQCRSVMQMLAINVLALRVVKKDPHEGHDHAPKKEKRVKGLWTVQIHGHQEFDPMMHYMWLYEGSQWKQKLWAILAVIVVFTLVLFPLWPLFMRQGVWYLSVAAMGVLAAFFAMAIFRLILFCITVFTHAPGLWLFPNLFEDVGFFDSFKPVWGWQETKKDKEELKRAKKEKKAKKMAKLNGTAAAEPTKDVSVGETIPANGTATATAVEATAGPLATTKRHTAPTVEEADDE